MLKFLTEYKNINALISKAETMAIHKFILGIIPRIAFFFYFIFDTLIVLTKIKFLHNTDIKWLTHKWASMWQIANLVGILGAIVDLVEIGKAEVKLIAQRRVASNDGDSNTGNQSALEEIKKKQSEIADRKFKCYLTIIKTCGDTFTSSGLLGWDERYLGTKFTDGLIGLGGLTSGAIACYSSYPAAPKKV